MDDTVIPSTPVLPKSQGLVDGPDRLKATKRKHQMLESGLYSILLKWGLDTVAGVIRDKDPKHVEIILEAIKTRNAIVLKRFEYAWEVAQEINACLESLEGDLGILLADVRSGPDKHTRAKSLIARLESELHPVYYRRMRKARNKLEATNDLFSAYSIEFCEMLRFDNMRCLLQGGQQSVSDIARTYRHVWDTFGAVVATLIRVTSYDLRFWLADVSYFQQAERQAAIDRERLLQHMANREQSSWMLTVEDSKAIDAFWLEVESSK